MAKVSNNIGFPRDNDGNLLEDHPIEVFDDMVLLENHTVTNFGTQVDDSDSGLVFHTDLAEHTEFRGWRVVAFGELVSRFEKGDLVSMPIGQSITPVQHPLIAKGVMIKDKSGNEVLAKKEHLDYVYAVVNQRLIGAKYK